MPTTTWRPAVRARSGRLEVTCDEHCPPLARIVASTIRRRCTGERPGWWARRVRGTVALRSTSDPQAAMIQFDRGAIVVGPGSEVRASLVIETDLSGSSPQTPPLVKGALRHPILAVVTGRLLDPPPPQRWKEVVESVWNELPGADIRPNILVRCTDRAEDLNLGGGDGPTIELHGPAHCLVRVFAGDQYLADAVESGHLQVVADLPTLSVLSGALLRHAMGERGDLDGTR